MGVSADVVPFNTPSTASDVETLFEPLTPASVGMAFNHKIDYDHPLKLVHHSSMGAGGVAIGDVNGDTLPDVFVTKGPGDNALFINQGGFKFIDRAKEAGVDGQGAWSSGAAMADVDNDGDLDLYVANYDTPNHLFINDGKGQFVERGVASGLGVADGSLMASFCDYDHDGDLDVMLVCYRLYWPSGRPDSIKSKPVGNSLIVLPPFDRYFELEKGDPDDLASWPFYEVGRPNILFRNNGDGTFLDVTAEAGIGSEKYMSNSAVWYDYNNDGWMDLYVGNDFLEPDRLFENQGDGTFRDVIRAATPHTPWYSMGSGTGDLNGDGYEDLLVADMAATSHYTSKVNMGSMDQFQEFLDTSEPRQFMRNAVYMGTGTHRLMEGGYLTGLGKSGWSWAVHVFDANCDGRNDVFISNGMARDFMNADFGNVSLEEFSKRTAFDLFEDKPERREKNLAFVNRGDLSFKSVGKEWGLDFEGMSYGAARGDLDGDGDLDLVVCNLEDELGVFRNLVADGARIGFRFRGVKANRFGIGARVEIETADGKRQVQTLLPHQGFASSNQPVLYFGLGDLAGVTAAQVIWPGGTVQELGALDAGQLVEVIEEAENRVESPKESLFASTTTLTFARHKETAYDDFSDQPLLPNKLSQNGPGIAFADVDGDGDEDFFIGGAVGQMGELHLQQRPGEYKWKSAFVLGKHKVSEDMAPLFFDVDGDDDLDLYVASGGVEQSMGTEFYRDRLYLNNGEGKFSVAPDDRLPDLRDSSGVVTAADYDRDGDLDLFVGSRSIPQRYPLPASSRLLRNDGGTFTDVSSSVFEGLRDVGLVTSAVWSDVNNDGWIDLLLTSEWGPIKYFRNESGNRFRERTEEAGLADRTGWWNAIAGRDMDNDGDIDYFVSNAGLNTKYKATTEFPATIYYGDFDGTGKPRCVEASFEDGVQLPTRGRSCSSGAMPFIGEKFGTFHDFALASLQEVYTPSKLGKALKLEANDLRSVVLINDGQGRFSFVEIPRDAQAAPGFGVVLSDFNADGLTDACMAQNFFHPQRETPRLGGGLGALLMGKGDGTFEHVWIRESGIDVPEDARALAVADLDDDRRPDLVFSINDGIVRTFANEEKEGTPIVVELKGALGNRSAVGARVTVAVAVDCRSKRPKWC